MKYSSNWVMKYQKIQHRNISVTLLLSKSKKRVFIRFCDRRDYTIEFLLFAFLWLCELTIHFFLKIEATLNHAKRDSRQPILIRRILLSSALIFLLYICCFYPDQP